MLQCCIHYDQHSSFWQEQIETAFSIMQEMRRRRLGRAWLLRKLRSLALSLRPAVKGATLPTVFGFPTVPFILCAASTVDGQFYLLDLSGSLRASHLYMRALFCGLSCNNADPLISLTSQAPGDRHRSVRELSTPEMRQTVVDAFLRQTELFWLFKARLQCQVGSMNALDAWEWQFKPPASDHGWGGDALMALQAVN